MNTATTPSRRGATDGSMSTFTVDSGSFGSVRSTGLDSPLASMNHVDDEAAVGLSGSDNEVGNRRAMLQLINRLHDIGIQTDIDLPMIAVIGIQSAGKSSLIESISGITLPRSSGTCTRCPTECKLSRSNSPWKCLVKLHFSTDARGVPVPIKIIPFGDPITSKSLVEDRIWRAQRAILNPSVDPNRYLQENLPDEHEVSFSKNYVSLEISGAELTDLSFVDLPGLIASVGTGGDERDIELVRSLVTSYIEKKSCIILLTVACETDFENQGAHNLAKRYDPEGQRTVGVLTKPDRIPPGDEHKWLQILRNEREELLNNWYCVKQPSSRDVSQGITWREARRRENEWFSSTLPWSSLEPQYQRYLGTSCLTERLSLILPELIAQRLPQLREELTTAIQETEKKLRALPRAPSSDPTSEVFHVIRCFVRELENRVEGTPEVDGLLQTIRPYQTNFKHAIRETAPKFVPWKRDVNKELAKPTFLYNEDGADNVVESDTIYVDEVLKRAEDARTRELPHNYPFVVQLAYIKQISGRWNEPAMALFEKVYAILKADVAKLVNAHFGHMGNGNSIHSVLMIVDEHLEEAADRTKKGIRWLLDLEGHPTTLNTHYYMDYKNKFLNYYKASQDDGGFVAKLNRERLIVGSAINRVIAGLGELGISSQPADIRKLLSPDPMEAALDIMAGVRAYFQVAYKRFTDMVPMAIDHEMVLGIKNGIDKALQEGLQITGSDGYRRCKAMLEEPSHIVSARHESQEKLQRLHAACAELRRLM